MAKPGLSAAAVLPLLLGFLSVSSVRAGEFHHRLTGDQHRKTGEGGGGDVAYRPIRQQTRWMLDAGSVLFVGSELSNVDACS